MNSERLDAWAVVLETREQRTCAEAALVLAAREIEHRSEALADRWFLSVPSSRLAEARTELAQYAAENRRTVQRPQTIVEPGDGWPGVLIYVSVLLAVATLAGRRAFGFDWFAAGRLVSSRALDGEWWRLLTALTLHVDLAHLLGNAAFGGFFGYFVGRYLGEGMGWAFILLAGVSGNFFNALIQPPGHRAVGASTAVFGALGILAAYAWRTGTRHALWRTRWGPIVAGIALLAYTGTAGEHTDVLAHLTGFLSGLLLGVAASFGKPPGARLQALCGLLALAVLAGAWLRGLAG